MRDLKLAMFGIDYADCQRSIKLPGTAPLRRYNHNPSSLLAPLSSSTDVHGDHQILPPDSGAAFSHCFPCPGDHLKLKKCLDNLVHRNLASTLSHWRRACVVERLRKMESDFVDQGDSLDVLDHFSSSRLANVFINFPCYNVIPGSCNRW